MLRKRKHSGKPPRPPRRRSRIRREPNPEQQSLIVVVILGFLVLGSVASFAWSLDRQLRGGVLAQAVEAGERPDWVRLANLPDYVPKTFLAVSQPGVSEAGNARAGNGNLSRDLVRQIHLTGDGLVGEARERVMGPVLERRTSPAQLLEIYLNRVHLGEANGYPVYGIQHAAEEYFGKLAIDLTLSESATLAALLLQPRIMEPVQLPGAVGARRNEVLRALLRAEMISEPQYLEAISERLGFQPGLRDLPMTRPFIAAEDTSVIRIPAPDRPQPEEG